MGIWQLGRSALKSLQQLVDDKKSRPAHVRRLRLEPLETRTLLTVTVNPITGPDTGNVFDVPSGKNLFVPITGSDSSSDPITYSVSSSNSSVSAQVLSGNTFLEMNVSGTDAQGDAFSGTLVFELFSNIAPQTVAAIETDVNNGLYNGAEFYRSEASTGFQLIQGGIQPPTGTLTGKTVPSVVPDEFNANASFNSEGMLAMANAGAGTATSEFFVTNPDVPLSQEPQSLNFGYTIFGQLVSGTTTYDEIEGVKTTASGGIDYDNTPVTITSASIVTEPTDAVVEISEPSNFNGSSTITVTGTASDGSAQQSFTVDAAPPSSTGTSTPPPLYLAPVAAQTTQEGKAITFQLSATDEQGGTPAYSVTGTSSFTATPSNVTVSVNGNSVTLTPTAGFTGTIDLVAHANDSTNGLHDALPFALTVNPQIAISQTTVSNATVNTAYSQTLTATGTTGTANFAVTTGALPTGLTLSSAGVISGTPTTTGNYNFTITATDSANSSNTTSQTYSMVVDQSISITTTNLAAWTVNQPGYSQQIVTTGGTGTITDSITSGSLPLGLTLTGGVISGTPTTAGQSTFTITATDSLGSTASQTYTLTINGTLSLSPTSLPNWTVNQPDYGQTLTHTGGTGTVTYSVTSGSLPAGLTLTSGVISGTPTATGESTFTITATDSTGATATQTYTNLTINSAPSITTTTLPTPDVGTAYTATISTSGGTGPLTYSVTSGTLPAGLTFNSNGTITGTPTTPVAAKITVEVTDAAGATATEQYSLDVIGGPLTLSPGALPNGTADAAYDQVITVVGGTPAYGTPAISNFNAGGTGLTQSNLVVNASAGTVTVTGTPTAGGTLSFTISDTDSASGSVSQTYTVVVNPPLQISPTTLPQGKAGVLYDQTVTVTGGTTPYTTFSVTNFSGGTTGLTSSDITSNSAAGTFTINGTPTEGGSVTFTVKVVDTAGATLTENYTLAVAGPVITPTTLTGATAGKAYSQTITVTDTSTPYATFTVTNFSAGTTGLTQSDITANSGAGTFTISGTPSAAGSATFTVEVTDAAGATVTQNYTIAVNPALTVTPATLTGATVNQAYDHTLTVSGGTTPYTTFTITNFDGASTGLTASNVTTNSTAGTVTINGTPTAAGSVTFTVDVVDSAGANITQNYTLTVNPALSLSATSLPAASANSAYDHTLTVSGGTTPYSTITITNFSGSTTGFTASEITTSTSAGTIVVNGTPTAGGTATFTVTVTDAAGATLSQNYSITVNSALAISPTGLPSVVAGTAYSQTLSVSGGTASYSSITISNFSAGTTGFTSSAITTNTSTGVVTISGTPTGAGSASFTVNVTDSSGATLSQTYTISVTASNTASLTGYVYDALAGGGAITSSDPLIAGVYVTLSGTDASGNPLQTHTVKTNSSGAYTFSGLAAGTYTLSMDQPSGLTGGSSYAGNLGGTASGSEISSIAVTNGASGTNYDFNAGGVTAKQIVSYGINLFLASTPSDGNLLTTIIGLSGNESATAPVVTSIAKTSSTSPTSAATVDYTVNFSQSVTGVNAADFSVAAGSGITGASVSSVTGSGSTYTVAVNTGSGAGTVGLDVLQSNSIVDADGNSLSGAATGNYNFVGPLYTISKIAVTVASVTTPINQGNEAVTGVSGTGESGATVSVVASDGTHSTSAYTTTVATNGTWSISNINVTSLNDGTLTYTATATDSEGGTATANITASKATTAPTIAVTTVTSPINTTNDTSTSVSGTGTAGDTVSVVASDGTNKTTAQTTTVATNGTWTVSGINVSSLNDGTITYTATITAGGNSTPATITTTKNTAAPSVTITSATNPINFTNESAVSVSGTAAPNSTVSVVASDGTNSTTAQSVTVGSSGTWSLSNINVSSLDNGTITFTATATLDGNSATTTFSSTKNSANPTVAVSTVTNPINGSNDTAVAITGTGEAGATISLVASDSASNTTPAATTTVASNGTWTITGYNVSSLADGTITFTATLTDASNNTAHASQTATKDTVTPTVSVTSVTSPINAANDTATSITGTVNEAATISVVASENGTSLAAQTTSVTAAGNWTISGINVSSLADGTITYTVTVTDAGDNHATTTTTATKDTVAPTVAVTTVTSPINSTNDTATSISGTVSEAATISVVASENGTSLPAQTTSVTAAGNWTVSGINVSSLPDGTITYTVTATDTAGNKSTSPTKTSLKDSNPATVTVSSETNPINISNEADTSISGTGEANSTISVVVSDHTSTSLPAKTTTVDSNGNWTISGINVSTLADGTITYTVTDTDAAQNTDTVTATSSKGTVAPTVTATTATNPINIANQTTTSVSGTGTAGDTVSVVASINGSAISPQTATVGTNGNWTVGGLNVSGLPDGTITYTATITDSFGNTAQGTITAVKDTVVPAVAITTAPTSIDLDNEGSFTVSGTAEDNVSISLTVSDANGKTTKAYTTTAGSSGNWSISGIDVSALADGSLTISAEAIDNAGNTNTTTATATKSTVAIVAVTNPINIANEHSISISGTGQVDASISLDVKDTSTGQVTDTTTVGTDGTWTISGLDVSSLADGTITFTVTASDVANNSQTATTTASKLTVTPTVALTTLTNPINNTNDTDTSASGTGDNGDKISVVATDGSKTTTAVTATVSSGAWSIGGIDVSGLADGTITYTATETDAAGNTATSQLTATKNTVAPTVTISTVTSPINMDNDTAVSISGTATAGDTINVDASDGVNTLTGIGSATVTGSTWSITGMDVSTLNDGTITFTVTDTNAAGNTATATTTATKSTVVITSVTSPINAASDSILTVNGTGEANATITLTAANDGKTTTALTTTVNSQGAWSISGVDVSGLDDGTITFTALASDTNNSATATFTATKSTVAITSVTNPIDIANEASTSVSGTGIANAQISVTATDGTHTTSAATTTVGSGGTWSVTGLNVSSLSDGTITFTVNVTNPNLTTGVATMTSTKDTLAPTVSAIDLADASPTTSDTLVYTVNFSENVTGVSAAAFQLVVGTGVNGATIASVTGSGSTYTVTADVNTGSAGTLGLDLESSGSGIEDTAGNPLGGPSQVVGPSYTITVNQPAVVDQALAGETSWI